MKASINKNREHAYVLRMENIKAIWDLLQNRIGNTIIIVKCLDDIEREYDTWKQFSSFENPPNKTIKHLIIKSRSDDYKKSAKIEFSDSMHRIIDINIDATEQVVSRLYDDISDIMDGIKPWYAGLTKIDFFDIFGIIFIPSFIILFAYAKSLPEKVQSNPSTFQDILLLISIIIMFFILLGLIVISLNKFRERYFPLAYFAIGQGEQRFNLDEKIRWSVIVAFFVSISTSFVFWFIG